MKFVAHRGESEAAPENTLESFNLAWSRGARCIEADFHRSRDGVIVCMHDANANRTCGVNRNLGEMTLAEIKTLDCGAFKGPMWRYTRVPTLHELLGAMPRGTELYLELKSGMDDLEELARVLAEFPLSPTQIRFIAFDETLIRAAKRRFPTHPAYWLTSNTVDNGDRPPVPRFSPAELTEKLRSLGVDGVDINARHVCAEQVEAVHRAGLSFHVWTVDDAPLARTLIRCGVDSITTNRCYALQHELEL